MLHTCIRLSRFDSVLQTKNTCAHEHTCTHTHIYTHGMFYFLPPLLQIVLLGILVLAGHQSPLGLGTTCSRLFWLSKFPLRSQLLL